jgi:hypothetical protein
MRYRNAFAHGVVEFEGNEYVLKYFESAPKRAVLDVSYWKQLESRINEPWDALLQIESTLEQSGA